MELKFIDKMFEMGDLENLKADDLKAFIKKRANEKLNELGYESIFNYSEEAASQLDWFYHLTGGHTHTDFFAIRPTDYANSGKLTPFGEYINMLNENSKRGPAEWIIVSPRVANELNKLKNNKENGRK